MLVVFSSLSALAVERLLLPGRHSFCTVFSSFASFSHRFGGDGCRVTVKAQPGISVRHRPLADPVPAMVSA